MIEKKPAQYFASFLILEGLMIGVFAALDALLFYVFWEAMLIPMFIIIGVWGERAACTHHQVFLYTFWVRWFHVDRVDLHCTCKAVASSCLRSNACRLI